MNKLNTKYYYIYKLTSPSGNVYIGQTGNFRGRMINHKWSIKSDSKSRLINSIKSYGWENFKKQLLVVCTNLYVDQIEKDFIRFYTDLGISLNLESGGRAGKRVHIETINKIRKKITGENNPFYGKTHTPETKKEISETLKGKYRTGKFVNAFKDHKHSDETKEKIGNKARGRECSDETRKKMSKAHKGRKFTEEHKEKLKLARVGFTHKEETKIKISKGHNKPVNVYDLNNNFIKKFISQSQAAKELNLSNGSINYALNKSKGNKTKKYIIKYYNQEGEI